jgi:hypothetical protein
MHAGRLNSELTYHKKFQEFLMGDDENNDPHGIAALEARLQERIQTAPSPEEKLLSLSEYRRLCGGHGEGPGLIVLAASLSAVMPVAYIWDAALHYGILLSFIAAAIRMAVHNEKTLNLYAAYRAAFMKRKEAASIDPEAARINAKRLAAMNVW